MDQMAFDLNRAINEGYRADEPVIVLSDEGKWLHGRRELEACVRSRTSVSSASLVELMPGPPRRHWRQVPVSIAQSDASLKPIATCELYVRGQLPVPEPCRDHQAQRATLARGEDRTLTTRWVVSVDLGLIHVVHVVLKDFDGELPVVSGGQNQSGSAHLTVYSVIWDEEATSK